MAKKPPAKAKPLRFTLLIRVSTERQAKRGESLRTQDDQLVNAVQSQGGTIAKRYAGQEHATVGFERKLLDQLLSDAKRKDRPFDAVMVADPSRWSRDNVANATGLETLRESGVRFFVLGMEYDLRDPLHRFMLANQAIVNELNASTQKQKSMLNRIHRARRNLPACGKRPFGRIWNADKQEWSLDPQKVKLIRDIATRYIRGESLMKLAERAGMNHTNVCKVLRERCGTEWTQEFTDKKFGIHETIQTTIPALLPPDLIRKVRERLTAKRTNLHGGPSKYGFVLSGRIFCGACGYTMFGQVNRQGHLYYRHAHTKRTRLCPLKPRPWIRADMIEEAVLTDLCRTLGNPAAIERAVKAATPKSDQLLERQEQLAKDLAKIGVARNRIIDLVVKNAITETQSLAKLRELREREAELETEAANLEAALSNVPSRATIERWVEHFDDGTFAILDAEGNQYAGGSGDLWTRKLLRASLDDQRKLVATAFSGALPDGKPAGIYVLPTGGKDGKTREFRYELKGLLAPPAVAPQSSHCTASAPPSRRSWPRSPRAWG